MVNRLDYNSTSRENGIGDYKKIGVMRLRVDKVEPRAIKGDELVTVVRTGKSGQIVEIQHLEKMNTTANVKKLSKYEYVDIRTGEVRTFDLNENRSQNSNSLAKTFKKLRHLINNNFYGDPNEVFLTLTYTEQTRDHLKVGKDFDKFVKRLKYSYGDVDYIRVIEPHESGCWHLHVLLRFLAFESFYVPKEELAAVWGLGFIKVNKLSGVDNIGAYLSAYLADLEVPEGIEKGQVKVVDGKEKRFIKGGRLAWYPSGINIYTKSKNIKTPEKEKMRYKDAKKIVGEKNQPDFKKSTKISLDGFATTVTNECYNLSRR